MKEILQLFLFCRNHRQSKEIAKTKDFQESVCLYFSQDETVR